MVFVNITKTQDEVIIFAKGHALTATHLQSNELHDLVCSGFSAIFQTGTIAIITRHNFKKQPIYKKSTNEITFSVMLENEKIKQDIDFLIEQIIIFQNQFSKHISIKKFY